MDVTWKDLAPARADLAASLAPLQSQFSGLSSETRARKVDSVLVAMGRGERVPTVPIILSRALRRRATLTVNDGPMYAVIEQLRLTRPPSTPRSTGTPFGQ